MAPPPAAAAGPEVRAEAGVVRELVARHQLHLAGRRCHFDAE
jgi:hypothetical protein